MCTSGKSDSILILNFDILFLMDFFINFNFQKYRTEGHLGGSGVEHLPLAQVAIPGSWDRVPDRAPTGSLLLPLPVSLLLLSHESATKIFKK